MLIKPEEYARRRRQVIRTIGPGALAILPAAPQQPRNGTMHYPYRQDSDFLYLAGVKEPDSVLALSETHGSVLFCRERDPEKARWDGERLGPEAAVSELGFDAAYPIEELDARLGQMIDEAETVVSDHGLDDWVPDAELADIIHDMRLYKSRGEIRAMAASAELAGRAHRRAMRAVRPGMSERELAAELLHEIFAGGGEFSYEPIVGGGANACVLHYITLGDTLRDGDLVLIDAGAELDGYASDITRTFPVNGKFSDRQRALYEVVLEAQKQALARCQPGEPWSAPHEAAVRAAVEGMLSLGIVRGDADTLIETGEFREFYVHKTGHWIGLDVHDVGHYEVDGHAVELEPGMAFTVEPGIYIPPDADVDEAWRGMGIRIEDDVVITPQGHRNLSAEVPKTVADIEAWMAK